MTQTVYRKNCDLLLLNCMTNVYHLFYSFYFSFSPFGQTGNLSGEVTDESSNQSLTGATVSLA